MSGISLTVRSTSGPGWAGRRVVLGFRNYFCLMINILVVGTGEYLGRQDTGCQGSWDQESNARILFVFIYVKLVSKERLQHPAQPVVRPAVLQRRESSASHCQLKK